jgi:hypothetical protein
VTLHFLIATVAGGTSAPEQAESYRLNGSYGSGQKERLENSKYRLQETKDNGTSSGVRGCTIVSAPPVATRAITRMPFEIQAVLPKDLGCGLLGYVA